MVAAAESGNGERCQEVTAPSDHLSFSSPRGAPTLRLRSIVRLLEKTMERISARPAHGYRRSQTRKADSRPTTPCLRIGRALPRIAAGATAALAAVSAALCVFGPLSDQRALQLAAGPHGKGTRPERAAARLGSCPSLPELNPKSTLMRRRQSLLLSPLWTLPRMQPLASLLSSRHSFKKLQARQAKLRSEFE